MALNPAELSELNSNTNTFSTWLERTNELIASLTSNVVTVDTSNTGGVTVGNGIVQGVFGSHVLFANTSLRGGNVQTVGTLFIVSDTQFGAAANTVDVTFWGAIDVNGTVNVNGTITTEILEISVKVDALSDGIPLGNSSYGFDVYARDLFVSGDGTFDNNIDVANTIFTLNLDVSNRADVEDLYISNTGSIQALGTANGVGVPIGNTTHGFIIYGTTIYASNSVNVGANVVLNTTTVKVGNSTVNSTMTSTEIKVGSNVISNTSSLFVGNSTVNSIITSTTISVGANVDINTSSISVTNTTSNNTTLITGNAIDVDGTLTTNNLVVESTATFSANLAVGGSLTVNNFITSNNVTMNSNGVLVSTSTQTTIDQTTVSANAGIFAVKYIIAASKLSNSEISQGMMSTEILAMYDGNAIQSTQYASLESNTDVVLTFSVVGATMSLKVQCVDVSSPANYYIFNILKTTLRNVL